ncbi:hypothetical protein O9G_000355 [Rozella allomycis CSF55]|uniref:Uncharacterized protein n=1 Tax=Rozella allomycis (strain CSF55) TaxID=988480 RepID=A0A075ATX9_ROZAC|nr:hypothetical protein O9G_000355 [Rozella allomycis CSF55]|eukprot:EPZ33580.1 hypothetical protein O9G_000355 [Rozella allomycis CSF55]
MSTTIASSSRTTIANEKKSESISTKEYYLEQSLQENEEMRERLNRQETDINDLVTIFKQENEEKEMIIEKLTEKINDNLEAYQVEKNELSRKFQEEIASTYIIVKITGLNANISEKESNMKLIQQELHVIKDFREVQDMDRRYKDILQKMEKKFLEEKIRLQREANRKISELAGKAHKEAIANLTETQKSVFRENVRMAEALKYHMQEREELLKQNNKLVDGNKDLVEEKKLHDEIVKQKIVQSKGQNLKVIASPKLDKVRMLLQEVKIQELEVKVKELEFSLSFVIREFEKERQMISEMARQELDQVRRLADYLKYKLKEKMREMKYVRRSDLERFFLEALGQIRNEMIKEKKKNLDSKEYDFSENIDVSDMSLAQKEKVIKLLFSKMNGALTDPLYARTT